MHNFSIERTQLHMYFLRILSLQFGGLKAGFYFGFAAVETHWKFFLQSLWERCKRPCRTNLENIGRNQEKLYIRHTRISGDFLGSLVRPYWKSCIRT